MKAFVDSWFKDVKGWQLSGMATFWGGIVFTFLTGRKADFGLYDSDIYAASAFVAAVVSIAYMINPKTRKWEDPEGIVDDVVAEVDRNWVPVHMSATIKKESEPDKDLARKIEAVIKEHYAQEK